MSRTVIAPTNCPVSSRLRGYVRVVEVISGLGLGGAERALVQRLRNAPPQVATRVISTRPDLNELNHAVSEFADLVVLQGAGRLRIAAIQTAIDDFNPDIVVVHNPLESIRLLSRGGFSKAHRVVPVAHSDRASFSPLLGPALAIVLRLLNRRAAGHIAVSQPAAAGQQCAGSRQVQVVHLGGRLDAESAPLDAWPAGTARRWIAIGRFVSPKNFDGLIRAIGLARSQLQTARVHVLLVGYGAQEAQLRRLITEIGVEALVSIPGRVTDPSALLREAETLVVSSKHEGGPITAYEAAIAGCRIVATPVGACMEVVSDDVESILCSDSSDAAIAEGLTRAATQSALPDETRRQRATSAARWTVERTTAAFYQALDSMMKRS